MADPTTARELDLSPLPGKTYTNFIREWEEEFIYFVMVDRFHDGASRTSRSGAPRSAGFGTDAQLQSFYGGTLNGIAQHLNYISGLGCTAIWLSPVFENNPGAYHGYAIQNYLSIDPHFGTKQDLVDLVAKAHALDMRVILDVVVNHSGDNWSYSPDVPFFYFNDTQFPLGEFRRPDRPVPTELRNSDFYHRRGQIRNFDAFPEYQHGDFFSLKDFNNDVDDASDPASLSLLDVLTMAHCYWIREADIDGFRVDAVKHFPAAAAARFSSTVREYAESLGKRSFFLYGELIAGDDAIDRYIGPNTPINSGGQTVFYGLDSVLDFPLYFVLPNVLKGFAAPPALVARYDAQNNRALSKGQLGRYLVTFADNHDGVGQPDNGKLRFGSGAPDGQVIAAIGYLLCALGTSCIYYGTEQGFSGKGNDYNLREAMFDNSGPAGEDLLNQTCGIYTEIAKIAAVTNNQPALRFGRMYMREVSGDGVNFGLPQGQPCTLAFSRILANDEVLVAYNTSTTEKRADHVVVDSSIHVSGGKLTYLYGGSGTLDITVNPDSSCSVQIPLDPMQFVILR